MVRASDGGLIWNAEGTLLAKENKGQEEGDGYTFIFLWIQIMNAVLLAGRLMKRQKAE